MLTKNDEGEECHRLPYVWHSRSTWVVSATTNTPTEQPKGAARLFANGFICYQCTNPVDKAEHVVTL